MNEFVGFSFWNIVVTIINTVAIGALLVFVLWLVLRRRGRVWKYPSCGKKIQPYYQICPYCGAELKGKEDKKV